MKRNGIILIAVLAAVIAVIWSNRGGGDDGAPTASGVMEPGAAPGTEEAPKKGSAAPSFSLPQLDGTTTFQVGGKRDKALLVNFWASWCGPCDQEAPDLVALYDKYKDKLDLYAVNATNYDKVRNAREFVKEKGFVFPVLTDAEGEAGNAYKVFSFPTSFIIDRNGQISERVEGIISIEDWEKYLDKVTDF